jgi:hypothetical protein
MASQEPKRLAHKGRGFVLRALQHPEDDAPLEEFRHKPPLPVPEYVSSLEFNHVVFDQILLARHALCLRARSFEDEDALRKDQARWTYAYYLPRLWEVYERTHGKITDSYFCHNILAGVILTSRGELTLRYPAHDIAHLAPKFEQTLWQCTVQARSARELLLRWGGRRTLLRRLFSLVAYLLSVLDSQASEEDTKVIEEEGSHPAPAIVDAGQGGQFGGESKARIHEAISTANKELRETRAELGRLALRDTQWLYLLGMVPGIAVLIGLASLPLKLGILGMTLKTQGVETEPLLISLVAGGIGAIVSVMNRCATGKLSLDYQAGWLLSIISGMFRPILGGIFGLVVYALFNAGIIELGVPNIEEGAASASAEQTRVFFFVTVAFLAGFSERYATDMLSFVVPGGKRGEKEPDGSLDKGTKEQPHKIGHSNSTAGKGGPHLDSTHIETQ